MPANKNYERPKSDTTNDTAISFSVRAAESPEVPEELDGINTPNAGNTGIGILVLAADADESGGSDKQPMFEITCEPVINNTTGAVNFKVTMTPILGDGTDGTPTSLVVTHDQTMDAWQTAAGRARQA